MVKRFEVHWITLGTNPQRTLANTRPCVILSPDELQPLNTVIIAPLISGSNPYPWRVAVTLRDRKGFVAIDQIRSVDRSRLRGWIGELEPDDGQRVLAVLGEMFAP